MWSKLYCIVNWVLTQFVGVYILCFWNCNANINQTKYTYNKYYISCNWIFLQFSTLTSCLFYKNILHNDISMTMKQRLMRTYSVICWTKRNRKLAFFHQKKKNIKINYQDTLMVQGFSVEDDRYCIFDNILTPGRIESYCLIKYRCRWHCVLYTYLRDFVSRYIEYVTFRHF